MTSPHTDPDRHGVSFGAVVVTVDVDLGDCIISAPQPGLICTTRRKKRFNSTDEIEGAYGIQLRLSRQKPKDHPHAKDIAVALKFAGQKIKAHNKKRGRKHA
ncbi:MAG: hypothetical protein COB16_14350 [Rhodobacteraceae bacterium]|nr:MAG: hypothetical protein COB16_14350 [Paracoccaceae bacterium]